MRGTTGERVPATATVVSLSSFLECVAISYERSRHIQYYHDCPMACLTFPIVRADFLDSNRGVSPPPTADVGGAAPVAKKGSLRNWCTQYNDGHSFIRGRCEHPNRI